MNARNVDRCDTSGSVPDQHAHGEHLRGPGCLRELTGPHSGHQNNEHGESLGNYLELYGKIKNAVDPKITSFTTPSMTLEHGPANKRKQWVYKFDPPMLVSAGRTAELRVLDLTRRRIPGWSGAETAGGDALGGAQGARTGESGPRIPSAQDHTQVDAHSQTSASTSSP